MDTNKATIVISVPLQRGEDSEVQYHMLRDLVRTLHHAVCFSGRGSVVLNEPHLRGGAVPTERFVEMTVSLAPQKGTTP